ncbi:L-Aspartase-like protein [Pseudomassariella vexata]|uniref:L-Aspartase-like protein n=1 Tax=Pseudomassariella vexata TaxID=1141098 RepID=A0A1Y2DK88_9PEZI|nr:L-Aspartase-like protein [Pseudomassariella vexata]ORY59680.1 L-Aspartase-like protein [Pseudomassariella vexata]
MGGTAVCLRLAKLQLGLLLILLSSAACHNKLRTISALQVYTSVSMCALDSHVLNFLALLGGSLGKIALDVIVMSSNELGEVSEPSVPLRGASSTMPQKRKPISSKVILTPSKLLRAHASLGLDVMVVDFERALGPWHREWVAIPEAFVLAVGALYQASFALGSLMVNTDALFAIYALRDV